MQQPWQQALAGLGGQQIDLSELQRLGALHMLQGQMQRQNSGLASALMGITGGANGVPPRQVQQGGPGLQHQSSLAALFAAGSAPAGGTAGTLLQLGHQNGLSLQSMMGHQ